MAKIDNFKLEHFDNGISVYQNDNYYKFTTDAILLAKFCNIKHSDHVLEMCAGSGVISFYAYSLCPFSKIYLNEIQPKMCDIINENIALNGFKRKSILFNYNLKELKLCDFSKPVDVIICNPPYQKLNGGKINERYEIALARHELEATLEDIIKKGSELVKDKGRFYMVHQANRSTEAIILFHKYGFEVKQMQFHYTEGKDAYLVLIEAIKGANPGVKILKN